MAKLIAIDPGHGGSDPGAVNGKRYEKDDNLRMAYAVAGYLTAQGHDVTMTRKGDTFVELDARIALANSAGADLFISIHRNSFTSAAANGVENWVRYEGHRTAAEAVLDAVASQPIQSNRGVKKGDYRVLYNAKMPAMLLELGFISNAKDNDLFDAHFDAYAESIAKGICSALGEPYGESPPEESTDELTTLRQRIVQLEHDLAIYREKADKYDALTAELQAFVGKYA